MDKLQVSDILFGNEYLDEEDLRYNNTYGYMLSKDQYKEFVEIKKSIVKSDKHVVTIPLKTFDSDNIYLVKGHYYLNVLGSYLRLTISDYNANKKFLIQRRSDEIIMSRIFSEIEGTLNIENVNTTHKRIKEVCEKGNLTDKNDIIIRNMNDAINYIVSETPEFNRENLKKLYYILSKDCLDEEDNLNGGYYRNDSVTIAGREGAPYEKIEELMNSLFDFVAEYKNKNEYMYVLPHICHYYIVYVHPYFDYNGRTARMVSFWITWLTDALTMPLFLSEAINENKSQYYKAIGNTQDAGNDLTYFLGYIFETATKFSYIYKNVEEAEKKLAKKGDFLTNTERLYIKKIFIHNSDSYFTVKHFIRYVNNNISKQAAFNMLNNLTQYGILEVAENRKGEKIFRINQKFITYKID